MEGGFSRHVRPAKYKSKNTNIQKFFFLIQIIDIVVIKEPHMLYVTAIFNV